MRLTALNVLSISAAALALAGAAAAQSNPAKDSPLEAATASPADKPLTVTDAARAADVQRVMTLLTGSFQSAGAGEQPALVMHGAPVAIDGLEHTVLIEIARADAPAAPFRHAILHPYRRQGALRLRVFDLTGSPGLKDAIVGLWAAPQAFPKLPISSLTPNVDMPLNPEGEGEKSGFVGATTQPFPTTRDGAIEMTSTVVLSPGMIAIADAGFDADGKRVWGNDAAAPVVFTRMDTPKAIARTLEGGLIVITLVPPAHDATVLEENGELTAHYTGWLTDGTRFDSSRLPGREPIKARIPGQVIKGWNDGVQGMAKGERRRLIIPSALGYGDRAAGRGMIPANSTLIFDVEALMVDNTQPPTLPTAPGASPHTPGQPTTPTLPTPPTEPSTPVGKPPTNATPEKPR